jgi:hypothetical protein
VYWLLFGLIGFSRTPKHPPAMQTLRPHTNTRHLAAKSAKKIQVSARPIETCRHMAIWPFQSTLAQADMAGLTSGSANSAAPPRRPATLMRHQAGPAQAASGCKFYLFFN